MSVRVEHGDCREVMAALIAEGVRVDSIVTDPPYHLQSIVKRFGGANSAPAKANGATGVYGRASKGFMGKTWDGGAVAFEPETWALCLELLKPGGYLAAFGGPRNWHRLAVAIEDAGFEIRDSISYLFDDGIAGPLLWTFGTGFPKNHNVSEKLNYVRCLCSVRQSEAVAGHGEDDRQAIDAPGVRTPQGSRPAEQRPDESGIVAGQPKPQERGAWPHCRRCGKPIIPDGLGTALKPAFEPIVLARKPLSEPSIARNVLAHGVGAFNVDACKVGFASDADEQESKGKNRHQDFGSGPRENQIFGHDGKDRGAHGNYDPPRRWPANVCHDGSEEVLGAFAAFGESKSSGGSGEASKRTALGGDVYGDYSHATLGQNAGGLGDTGTAARFFFSGKAGPDDRLDSKHPTVKPIALMRWLTRLITPPKGLVLDPFAGTGTTGAACIREGFDCILIEREAESVADIRARLDHIAGADTPLFQERGT